jgi:serine-type D-Ala-D-Ala carboxypeptidase/endopeptidase (penicillin-binding protein 4)
MRPATSLAARAFALGTALVGALALGAAPTASADRVPVPRLPPVTTTNERTIAVEDYVRTAGDTRMISALTNRATTTLFGTSFSGAVIDAGTNEMIWRKNGTTTLIPASTTKLATAANALTVFGPDTRFTTEVRSGSYPDRVIIVGSGDPSLSSAGLDAMARTTASALLTKGIKAALVYVDDDVFPAPTLAYGWKADYVPDSITPVRGLVRDQSDDADTGAEAGRYFRDRLKAHGLPDSVLRTRVNAASTSTLIASTTGARVSTMVSRMLLDSDNEIAEALHKKVGIALGHGATWTGAQAAQAEVLASQGLDIGVLYDGSGLSRANRVSAVQLATIVDRGVDPRLQTTLWPLSSDQAMPTAGRTGTLENRFTTARSECAVGKVWAKTGTLADVVSLAGFTKGADGRVKAFAFIVNGKSSTTTLKQNIDMLAATVNGCY